MALINEPTYEDFTVTNVYSGFAPVTGLTNVDLNIKLFDQLGTESTSANPVTIQELGEGSYRASFTPTELGTWYLVIKHSLYFPWGKANDILVTDASIESVYDMVKRLLGLTQENYFMDYTTYNKCGCLTEGRIRTYLDSASVGTDNNVLATYQVTATYDTKSGCEMIDYKVEMI